jgi:hypothetical protein
MHSLDRDVIGKVMVQRAETGLRRMAGGGIESHHLASGVHTGVGAAGPSHTKALTREPKNGPF